MKLLSFTEGEWFKIAGRGHVFATKMPEDYEGSLVKKDVLINGHQYTVTGVEMFATYDTSLFKGRSVGLLVRGPRKDV